MATLVVFTKICLSHVFGLIVMAYFHCWTRDSDSDSDTDSCTMKILWERDPNLNLTQWKHILHNTM